MSRTPNSERLYAAGPTGSGKTELVKVWAARHQRRLILDATGEWSGEAPGRLHADSMGALSNRLQRVAGAPSWEVVIGTEQVDIEALVGFLTPAFRPGRTSYPLAVGGMCLILDEAYEVASQSNVQVVRPLWLRGRHHGLSVIAASQRPADVGRFVTSQSGRLAVTFTWEPRELDFWRSMMPAEWHQQIPKLQQYQAIEVDKRTRRARIITTRGELVRELPPMA